jgi:hypothetical protein
VLVMKAIMRKLNCEWMNEWACSVYFPQIGYIYLEEKSMTWRYWSSILCYFHCK